MILLIKLILAHLIGDFLLQPKPWVEEKERKKALSIKLYLHLLIHGSLVWILLWDYRYWLMAALVLVSHGIIDVIKLYGQKAHNKPTWFLIDQALHLVTLLILWITMSEEPINLTEWAEWINRPSFWIYTTALLFLTSVSGIAIQITLSNWSKSLDDTNEASLKEAGKYIGILERLFVFTFVVTGNWQAIGFLLAAKSVFRFGDLRESKDRKLTEYILIGTLLSFGVAVAAGLTVLTLLEP